MIDVWWKIDTFCKDSKTLSLDFDVCSFCWVYFCTKKFVRTQQLVTHALAKFASYKLFYFCYNFDSLTPSVSEACLRDVAALSF